MLITCCLTGFRLLSNYEICDGALLACKSIIEESNQVKENVTSGIPLATKNLGIAVKELWDGKVKVVKRGKRKQQTFFYLNLSKRPNPPRPMSSMDNSFKSLFSNHELPTNWASVADHENRINFIRLENWSYRNSRVKTELSITKTEDGEFLYEISCRGQKIDIENIIQIDTLTQQPIKGRVLTVIQLLDQSTLCQGVHIEKDALEGLANHEHGAYSDLSMESYLNEKYRGFSSDCKVISSNGTCCVSCSHFFHGLIWRKKHKVANTCSTIHPNTPKCFLSKEDVILQLAQERQARINAEARERYWRDKFNEEALIINEQDHGDLSSILLDQSVDNVPEEMQCLWKQQLKIAQSKKNGYRWHPK